MAGNRESARSHYWHSRGRGKPAAESFGLPDHGQQAVTDAGRILKITVKLGFEHPLFHDGAKGKQAANVNKI